MLQLIISPRVARHSAGWKVGRLISDRAGKTVVEPPQQWGRHRAISADDAIRLISQRIAGIAQVHALTRR